MTDLPPGWDLVPLGDVAETSLGKMLDRGRVRGHAQVPYLRNVNVRWGRIDTHDLLSMELAESERERFEVIAGDLLVCEGGEIGRCAIWPGSSTFIAYQKALHRVRPSTRLSSTYLRYLLEHQALTGVLAARATGSTIQHLPQQQLRRLPVPLPSIEEQRRIVDILEDHLSRLDSAGGSVETAERRLTRIRDSWFHAQSALAGAPHRTLGELLASPLRHGRSVPTGATGFPVLRLTAIRDGRVNLAERKIGAWTAAEAAEFLVSAGDFLVARGSGSLALVGRGGLVTDTPDSVAYPDTAIRVRVDVELLDPNFLALVWDSPTVHRQIEAMARTTAGIYKVNQADLRSVSLPLPSIPKQRHLVETAHQFSESHERLASSLGSVRSRSQALRRALLQAAFAGRLTGGQLNPEP